MKAKLLFLFLYGMVAGAEMTLGAVQGNWWYIFIVLLWMLNGVLMAKTVLWNVKIEVMEAQTAQLEDIADRLNSATKAH